MLARASWSIFLAARTTTGITVDRLVSTHSAIGSGNLGGAGRLRRAGACRALGADGAVPIASGRCRPTSRHGSWTGSTKGSWIVVRRWITANGIPARRRGWRWRRSDGGDGRQRTWNAPWPWPIGSRPKGFGGMWEHSVASPPWRPYWAYWARSSPSGAPWRPSRRRRSRPAQTSPTIAWGPALAAAITPLSTGIIIATLALVAYDGVLTHVEKLAGALDRLGAETIEAIALSAPPAAKPIALARTPHQAKPPDHGGPHLAQRTSASETGS